MPWTCVQEHIQSTENFAQRWELSKTVEMRVNIMREWKDIINANDSSFMLQRHNKNQLFTNFAAIGILHESNLHLLDVVHHASLRDCKVCMM
mmetsp:Transcript_33575/g.69863  ORF Transcript_33575/g.69863 Transcript_33575/m.69863 type:complete len:92 (-) Transcript_33575:509-784(-)